MSLLTRKFDYSDADIEKYIALKNIIYPDAPESAARTIHLHKHRAPFVKYDAYLMENDGDPIACAGYDQIAELYHPNKYHLWVYVHPDYQRQGVGSELYDLLTADLAPHNPIEYFGRLSEKHPHAMRFFEKRGYTEVMREWESRIDPLKVDLSDSALLDEKLRDLGISISAWSELGQSEEIHRKIYDVYTDTWNDIPFYTPRTPLAFDIWIERRLANPTFRPDAFFIAHKGDEFVGLTMLSTSLANDQELYQGLTGVRRAWRRKGVARALKFRTIEYALAHDVRQIKTFNASNNEGMIAINVAMGFQRQPAWINYAKQLD